MLRCILLALFCLAVPAMTEAGNHRHRNHRHFGQHHGHHGHFHNKFNRNFHGQNFYGQNFYGRGYSQPSVVVVQQPAAQPAPFVEPAAPAAPEAQLSGEEVQQLKQLLAEVVAMAKQQQGAEVPKPPPAVARPQAY